MAVNCSSPPLSYFQNYSNFSVAGFIGTSFLVTKFFLVLPLSLLVLYLGYQRWRQQRSFATSSHSDIFTYHSAAVELTFALGFIVCMCGLLSGLIEMMIVGSFLYSVSIPGEVFFHILTCIDRYLAVVHPVLYVRLRQSGAVRIRNISIGCVWLLCFGWSGLDFILHDTDLIYIQYFCLTVLSLVIVSFCSLSVLCVLIRPGPGEIGRHRPRVDQSKQRAFYTITAITGVLWLCFFGNLVSFALANSHMLNSTDADVVAVYGYWCSLPSSLVLPVLFLQRRRKMLCCLH